MVLGITWNLRTTPARQYSAVAYSPSLDLYAAVQRGQDVGGKHALTSPDGTVWTLQTAPNAFTNNDWLAVTWSPELGLFAASDGGFGNIASVMTSSDGITWTRQPTSATGASHSLPGITWSPELGLFMAVGSVGSTGLAWRSANGTSWSFTLLSSPLNLAWQSVVWSPTRGIFVAVAATGTGVRIMTSSDGINWTSRTSPADNDWRSVTWSPNLGLFVAVSSSGSTNRAMYSSDGIAWSLATTSAQAWRSVVWSSHWGAFVAVGFSGKIMSSTDGVTWVDEADVSPTANWNNLIWSVEQDIFVATSVTSGVGTQQIMSSDPIVVPPVDEEDIDCDVEAYDLGTACNVETYDMGECSDFEVY